MGSPPDEDTGPVSFQMKARGEELHESQVPQQRAFSQQVGECLPVFPDRTSSQRPLGLTRLDSPAEATEVAAQASGPPLICELISIWLGGKAQLYKAVQTVLARFIYLRTLDGRERPPTAQGISSSRSQGQEPSSASSWCFQEAGPCSSLPDKML